MPRNLNTSLKRRRRPQRPMDAYDRLPSEIRAWLREAHLPWSAQSVLKLWTKALRAHEGDRDAALRYLTACEARKLKKDAPEVWGTSYPISDLSLSA